VLNQTMAAMTVTQDTQSTPVLGVAKLMLGVITINFAVIDPNQLYSLQIVPNSQ
jgi:hypothetical protein